MDPNCNPEPPPRAKIPKDGWGPRGAPDCYYTSRVLDSTYRYVRFVKKLRQLEEEVRQGEETKLKEAKDKQTLDFFSRCDRKALIKSVEQRVKLCMESYEMDLIEKRKRLMDLLMVEEEMNMRKFTEAAQAGAAAIWQDKQDRLAYLLAKRKKEHEERYNVTPLSKCPNLYPCILKLQNKEAQEIHLYQMREKQMRKVAEAEMEKMWHEVAMRESEALAARMEMDAIERHRRDLECKQYTDYQLEVKRKEREKEREMLKQEAIKLREMVANNATIEAEDKRKRQEASRALGEEKAAMLKERRETVARQLADERRIGDTWDSLASQSRKLDLEKEEIKKQKLRDLDVCNQHLVQMKYRIEEIKHSNEPAILAEGQRIRDAADLKRCMIRKWSQQTQKDNAATLLQQASEKHKTGDDERLTDAAALQYQRCVERQLDELVRHKDLTEAQARKLYQNDLKEQIAYNNLLKERARQEQLDEMKKCQIATREYEAELCKMLARPFFSESVHPFMKRMAAPPGLRLPRKCPCARPDHCADGPPAPPAPPATPAPAPLAAPEHPAHPTPAK